MSKTAKVQKENKIHSGRIVGDLILIQECGAVNDGEKIPQLSPKQKKSKNKNEIAKTLTPTQ